MEMPDNSNAPSCTTLLIVHPSSTKSLHHSCFTIIHPPTPFRSYLSIKTYEEFGLLLLFLALILQVSKHLGEEVRVGVYLKHLAAHAVDDLQAAVPEGLLLCFNQERLQWVGDLIAHVRVGQVEAGEQ